MAQPLSTDSISLTGAGAALITDANGSIRPDAVEGLIVDDVRILSTWRVELAGAVLRRVGWERTGPSSDRLIYTVSIEGRIDPVAVFERRRTVTGRGLTETLSLHSSGRLSATSIRIFVDRDDSEVFDLGDQGEHGLAGERRTGQLDVTANGIFLASAQPAESDVEIIAHGWNVGHDTLWIDVDLDAVEVGWSTTISVRASHPERADTVHTEIEPAQIDSSDERLTELVNESKLDFRALTMPVEHNDVLAAGSPFFLALFGRDSMIAGMQFLSGSTAPLIETLNELARHQATGTDPHTGAQPGRILHELRLGHAGVFGVSPGTPYYGAVDTSALFVVALGEALRWGVDPIRVAALVPAAHAALAWCRDHGDVDGDGFIESVPHPTGLVNLGWKDSDDSVVDTNGATIVDHVALAEVQAYWYRALRSLAEIEQHLGISDGADLLREADALARRFVERFVYYTDMTPFVGLCLDGNKQLLEVRASNAGHVLWSGILAPSIANAVAHELVKPDMFSGWGVRTLSADNPAYNPFGYHRGSVWPHDTGFALHGASRYGQTSVVRQIARAMIDLGASHDNQLPELLSGISRDDFDQPVPYAAACRPQAWSAGAPLVAVRSLLGLEPNVLDNSLRLNPCLDEGTTITITDLQLGDRRVSFTVRGDQVIDADAPGIDIITGDNAALSTTDWVATPDPAPLH